MTQTDVLIAGAGPTGLVLALWLAKQGVQVRIIDKTSEPGTTSRALAVQARTLELYRQLGLTDEVLARGHKTPAVNLWVRGEQAAHVPFDAMGHGLTPHAFMLIFPQDQHERLLLERLQDLGVSVERGVELTGFEDHGDHVVAQIRGADGEAQTCQAAYIAGCDGAHSVVRRVIGADFPGGAYRQLFYVADVEAEGPAVNGELHIDLDEADFLAVFPMAGQGRARLIGTVRDERADHPESLTFEDVSDRAIQNLKVKVRQVNWFSTYHVHHRVTDRFRRGRAFLLGDAAHIHSPAGGQGMNTGIGDAINLAWKLAAVLSERAPDSLLDSYEAERAGFARRLVATTDKVFSFATAEGRVADLMRTRIAPLIIPRVASIDAARDYLFRTVGQLMLNYRDSPLSAGKADHVHGGDRLPWIQADGQDNFASLSPIAWHAHVYGTASAALTAWCAARGVGLTEFAWSAQAEAAGLARGAVYLMRPDSYVALVDLKGDAQALEQYFSALTITPHG